MTFDSRSRQAAQGIRRAVEVMEMSSTKTPQRLTRFDQYGEAKSRNKRVAALALGIAVTSLLVIAAVLVLRSEQDRSGPITSPSLSVVPTPTIGTSHQFREPFTYTSLPGWTFGDSDPGWLRLEPPPSEAHGTSFYVFSNVRATRPDCSDRLKQSVGASSDAITRWLSRHPALDATAPKPITLGAGSGSWIDLQLAPGWDQTCPGGPGGFPLLSNPRGGESWGIEHNTEKMRLYVLDLPAGNTVTVVLDAQKASNFKDMIRHEAPVVKSFDFSA
jgi:hypothetical protein